MELKITKKDENESTVEFQGIFWTTNDQLEELKRAWQEIINQFAI